MIPLSPEAIARAAGGHLVRPGGPASGSTPPLTAVFTDTRRPVDGGLFVALRGPRFDGHRFLTRALEGGARAVMVSDAEAARALPPHVAVIAVDDTLAGLQALAAAVRARHPGRVVALTGSSGKTTVKDMTAAALGAAGSVAATPGNWNNHIGLPLTLLGTRGDEAFLVLELGMSAAGEIDALTRLSRPDAGLVTNASAAHLAAFASVEAIADAKAELYRALGPDALAFANADDPLVLARARAARGDALVTWGVAPEADVRVLGAAPSPSGLAVRCDVRGQVVDLRLAALGAHNAHNAAAALAVAQALDVPVAAAAEALSAGYRPSPHRLALRRASSGLVVLDDCYNANPASARAALATLAEAAPEGAVLGAVLGTMRELGPTAPALHREVGAAAAQAGVKALFATGAHAADLAAGARAAGLTAVTVADDAEELRDAVLAFAGPGRWLLLKGSRGERLERLLPPLLDPADATPAPPGGAA